MSALPATEASPHGRTCGKCGRAARLSKLAPWVCLYCESVELLAGGWEPGYLSYLSEADIEQARVDGAKLRDRLLAEAAAKKARGRRRAPAQQTEAQQALL